MVALDMLLIAVAGVLLTLLISVPPRPLARMSHQDSGIWVKLAKQGKWRDRSHERPYREVWAGLRAKQGLRSAEGRSPVEA